MKSLREGSLNYSALSFPRLRDRLCKKIDCQKYKK